MPIATSRWCSRSPSSPMPIPARSVRATSPHSGAIPNSTAPVAPAKPTCDSAWPAKVCARSTRKNPTRPQTTATIPAAANGFCMKSYVNMVLAMVGLVRIALHVVATGHDEDAAVHMHHLDFGTIETRQHRSADDIVHGAQRGMAGAEVKHTIKRAEQRVDLMRAEQHRNAEFLLQRPGQLDHRALMMRIEADQRFIQQQQARAAQQGLRQQQTLPLAAGGLRQRTSRERG